MIDPDDPAIVIIGSGAGGGTLAHALTAAGKSVVLLEAGPRIGAADWIQDDMAAYAQLSWLDPRVATGSYAAARHAPTMPAWIVKAVGGSTLHWNGLSYRAQPHEFAPLSRYGAVSGASLIDWPVTYDDLAPYYDRAEDLMGVTGTHGIPPHPATNHYKVLHAAASRLGYSRISNAHIAINSSDRDGRPGCIQMGFCNQGCKINAKWSTLASEIPKAEATGRLDLRAGMMAVRIDHDAAGRANAVVYRDGTGALHRQRAGLVCVAGNAIETARLLLLSDSPAFPDGLANTHGHVGRHYMRHTAAMAFARLPKPVNMHRGIVTPGTIFDEAGHDETRGFAGGYLMEAAALAPVTLAMLVDPGSWGRDYADFIGHYDHLAGVLLNGEELPRANNRVTLSPDVKDAAGQPVAQVHVDEHPHCDAMRGHFYARARALFDTLGSSDVRTGVPPSATHNMGTCRMSADPRDGVTNAFGQCHDVPNLFISDGSVFSSSTAENPTLTIVALALRQADYILSGAAGA